MTYLQLTSQKHTTNLYSSFASAEIYHNLVKDTCYHGNLNCNNAVLLTVQQLYHSGQRSTN